MTDGDVVGDGALGPDEPSVLSVPVPPIGEPRAEAALLGCLLALPVGPARALLARLDEGDWTVPAHQTVATAIGACLAAGVRADPVTVLAQLRRAGTLPSTTQPSTTLPSTPPAGDLGLLLLDLTAAAPCPASGAHYAAVVLEHAYRTRLQTAAVRLLQAAHHSPLDGLADLLDNEVTAVRAAHTRLHPPTPAPQPTAPPPRAAPRRQPSDATTSHPSRSGRTA